MTGGLCQCGCGGLAPLSPYNDASRGYVKGQPMRYIKGHHQRSKRTWTVTPGPLPTPCWVWDGKPGAGGYGVIVIAGVRWYAHRWLYTERIGDPGGQLDHLCRVRLCVNPDHLESVTQRENVLRGVGPTAANAAKTHCLRGHPLSGPNLIVRPDGGRTCKTCLRASQAKYDERVVKTPEGRAKIAAYMRERRRREKSEGHGS